MSETRWPSESHHSCHEIASRGEAHSVDQNVVTLLCEGHSSFINGVTLRIPVCDAWVVGQQGLLAGRVTDLSPILLIHLYVAHQLTCLSGFQARLLYRLCRSTFSDVSTQLRSYGADCIYRWAPQLLEGVGLRATACLNTNVCSLCYLQQPFFPSVLHHRAESCNQEPALSLQQGNVPAPCFRHPCTDSLPFQFVMWGITITSKLANMFCNSYYVCICDVLPLPILDVVRTVQDLENLKHGLRMTWRKVDL